MILNGEKAYSKANYILVHTGDIPQTNAKDVQKFKKQYACQLRIQKVNIYSFWQTIYSQK